MSEKPSLFVINEDKTILNRSFSAFDETRLSFACTGGSKYWVKLEAGSELAGISYQLEAVYNDQNSNLEIEPNDSSEDVTLSSLPLRKVGSLGEIEDRDIYRFEVLNSSVLELELTSISQGFDKMNSDNESETWSIKIKDIAGNLIDSFIIGEGTRSMPLINTGEYFIEVSRGFYWKGGDYELNVVLSDLEGSWESEPNNDRLNSSAIEIDGNLTRAKLSSSMDEDWFEFELNDRSVLAFSILTLIEGNELAADSNKVWELAVYSEVDENPVRKEVVGSAQLVKLILEEGRHYVQIKPVANRINLDEYLVRVSTLASDSESNKDFEPNDNVANANSVRLDLPLQGNLEGDDTQDWYRFQLDSPGVLRLIPYQLENIGTELKYELLGDSETGIQYGILSLGTRVEIPILTSGFYSLVIRGNSAKYGLGFDYSLRDQLAETESNDVLSDANLIPLGTRVVAVLEDGLDVDWFEFPTSKTGVVKFELASRSDDPEEWFKLTTYLADANDHITELGEIWISGSRELSVLVSTGSRLYGMVSSLEQFNSEPTAYSLIGSFDEDLFLVEAEPNGEHENADAMNFEEEIAGKISHATDVDWYKISVIGGGTLTLDGFINGKEGKSEWSIHLYREGEFDWSNPRWMMGHRWWGSSVETYALAKLVSTILKYILTPKLILTRLINLLLILSWDYPE